MSNRKKPKAPVLSPNAALTPEVKQQQQAEAAEVLSARKALQNQFFGKRLDIMNTIQAHNKDQPAQEVTPEEVIEAGVHVEPLEPIESTDDPVITRSGVSKKLSEWTAEVDAGFARAAQTATRVRQEAQAFDENELDSIAEAVNAGSKEQTKEAIKKVINQASEVARQQAAHERTKNEAIRLMRNIIDENKDMSIVPMVYARVQQVEKSLAGRVFVAGDQARDAEARLKEAYKVVRVEWDKMSGATQVTAEIEATNARKAAAIQAPATSSRTTRPSGTQVLSEKEANAKAIADSRRHRDAQRRGV